MLADGGFFCANSMNRGDMWAACRIEGKWRLFTPSSWRGGPNAAGELERLFAPLAGFMSDLSLAGGNADETHPPESGLAA